MTQAQSRGGEVLRRKAAGAEVASAAEVPSPARLLRRAFARAAARTAGLTVGVLGVADETLLLDDLLSRLPEGALLLSLAAPGRGGPAGLAALDLQTVSALIEAQLTGCVRSQAPRPRAMTATDAALAAPVVGAFLSEVAATAGDGPLSGWAEGAVTGKRLADVKAAEIALPHGPFRMVSLTLDLGVGERQGQVLVALLGPRPTVAPGVAEARAAAFNRRLRENVLSAEAPLTAVLHRMRLPFAVVEGLRPGQVIALPGVRVTSVRLEGPNRQLAARGRLGQSGGLRAIRVETPAPSDLLPGIGEGGAPPPSPPSPPLPSPRG
jgi:flagellar motor switch protein FliM